MKRQVFSKKSGKDAPRRRLSYEHKKSLYGYGFISLWLVGFLLFFLRPFVSVIIYSLSKIEYLDTGHRLVFRGLDNFRRALLEDPDIIRMMADSIKDIPVTVITIVIVSLAIAVVLNRKFFGRTAVRAIFFVPVIVASGIVISILNGDAMASTMMAGQKSSAMLQVSGLTDIMMQMGLPEKMITTVTGMANGIFDYLWKSGIQILLFLAALQTISPSLYEASALEGATGWDNFWKISMPMVSPMILLAFIYSIIDSFTDYDNQYMQKIKDFATSLNVEYSSTLSLLYFVVITLFIGLAYLIIKRFVADTGE